MGREGKIAFMKRPFLALGLLLSISFGVLGQAGEFPGVTPEARKELNAARLSLVFALPSWVPAGFAVTTVESKLGPKVKTEDRQFVVVYSRQLPGGKKQRFALEAGFDGLGDLMYDGARKLVTPIGPLYLVYQPKDEDGKKLLDFAMTEWFSVGRTAFHYDGMYGIAPEGDASQTMLSLAETERLLKSLRRY